MPTEAVDESAERKVISDHCGRLVNRVVTELGTMALHDGELVETLIQATALTAVQTGQSAGVVERYETARAHFQKALDEKNKPASKLVVPKNRGPVRLAKR